MDSLSANFEEDPDVEKGRSIKAQFGHNWYTMRGKKEKLKYDMCMGRIGQRYGDLGKQRVASTAPQSQTTSQRLVGTAPNLIVRSSDTTTSLLQDGQSQEYPTLQQPPSSGTDNAIAAKLVDLVCPVGPLEIDEYQNTSDDPWEATWAKYEDDHEKMYYTAEPSQKIDLPEISEGNTYSHEDTKPLLFDEDTNNDDEDEYYDDDTEDDEEDEYYNLEYSLEEQLNDNLGRGSPQATIEILKAKIAQRDRRLASRSAPSTGSTYPTMTAASEEDSGSEQESDDEEPYDIGPEDFNKPWVDSARKIKTEYGDDWNKSTRSVAAKSRFDCLIANITRKYGSAVARCIESPQLLQQETTVCTTSDEISDGQLQRGNALQSRQPNAVVSLSAAPSFPRTMLPHQQTLATLPPTLVDKPKVSAYGISNLNTFGSTSAMPSFTFTLPANSTTSTQIPPPLKFTGHSAKRPLLLHRCPPIPQQVWEPALHFTQHKFDINGNSTQRGKLREEEVLQATHHKITVVLEDSQVALPVKDPVSQEIQRRTFANISDTQIFQPEDMFSAPVMPHSSAFGIEDTPMAQLGGEGEEDQKTSNPFTKIHHQQVRIIEMEIEASRKESNHTTAINSKNERISKLEAEVAQLKFNYDIAIAAIASSDLTINNLQRRLAVQTQTQFQSGRPKNFSITSRHLKKRLRVSVESQLRMRIAELESIVKQPEQISGLQQPVSELPQSRPSQPQKIEHTISQVVSVSFDSVVDIASGSDQFELEQTLSTNKTALNESATQLPVISLVAQAKQQDPEFIAYVQNSVECQDDEVIASKVCAETSQFRHLQKIKQGQAFESMDSEVSRQIESEIEVGEVENCHDKFPGTKPAQNRIDENGKTSTSSPDEIYCRHHTRVVRAVPANTNRNFKKHECTSPKDIPVMTYGQFCARLKACQHKGIPLDRRIPAPEEEKGNDESSSRSRSDSNSKFLRRATTESMSKITREDAVELGFLSTPPNANEENPASQSLQATPIFKEEDPANSSSLIPLNFDEQEHFNLSLPTTNSESLNNWFWVSVVILILGALPYVLNFLSAVVPPYFPDTVESAVQLSNFICEIFHMCVKKIFKLIVAISGATATSWLIWYLPRGLIK